MVQARELTLHEKDAIYCSWGDTVHYADPPKFFSSCDGCYLQDEQGVPYLDLQMWYSAVNFGYRNARLNEALKRQIDTLPQLACQYLHKEKVQLAELICARIERDLRAVGLRDIAGVDEVGRGPLAGPVVACAIIMPPGARAIAPRISNST